MESPTERISLQAAPFLYVLPDIHSRRKSICNFLSIGPFYANAKGFFFLSVSDTLHLTGMQLPCSLREEGTLVCTKLDQELFTTLRATLRTTPLVCLRLGSDMPVPLATFAAAVTAMSRGPVRCCCAVFAAIALSQH